MSHGCRVALFGLTVLVMSSCGDRNDVAPNAASNAAASPAVGADAAAQATRVHGSADVAPPRLVGVDGAPRWTIATGPLTDDWYAGIRAWNRDEARSVDLEAQPAWLAWVEIGQDGAIERADIAAALARKGLQLQQLAPIELGDGRRGFAVELTAPT